MGIREEDIWLVHKLYALTHNAFNGTEHILHMLHMLHMVLMLHNNMH